MAGEGPLASSSAIVGKTAAILLVGWLTASLIVSAMTGSL
jgi:hypothetical protein